VVLHDDIEQWRPSASVAGMRSLLQRLWSTASAVRGARQLVISEENLLGLMPGHRAARGVYASHRLALRALQLAAHASELHVRWIVRRQDRFLESVYAFRVSRGATEGFESFAARIGPGLRWAGIARAFASSGLTDARIQLFEDLFRDATDARLGAFLLLPGSESWSSPVRRRNTAVPWPLQVLLYLNREAHLSLAERPLATRALRGFAKRAELPRAAELAAAFAKREVSRLQVLAEPALAFARAQPPAAFDDEARQVYLRSVADDTRELFALPIVHGDRSLWQGP
jgi:hypothetical protein